MTPRHHWTPEQEQQLSTWYADHKTTWIAKQLGLDVKQVYAKANGMGLRKSRAFLASEASGRLQRHDHRGRTTQFKPGQKAWNKGTSYQPGGRCAETQFKKGTRNGRAAQLWQPIGSERVTDEGYRQRKMTDTGITRRDYVNVHWLLWIEHHGPIPPGHVVVFKDGDRTHIAIENLECITRTELMKRNTRHQLPKELSDLIALRGALNRKINAILRKDTDEQSDDR